MAQPDDEFSRLLDEERDVTNSFERIDGLFEWAEQLQESNREPTDDEEKSLLHVSRWIFQDRGVSRRLFLVVESEEDVPHFFANLLKDLGLASTEAIRLLDGLKQLAKGALSIDQFLDKFDASDEFAEEDIQIVSDEILETLGPDFLSELEAAVREADEEDQKRGSRKAKRRMVR